ncbi:MAG: flagellar biosynthetic protein FliO [Desulfuromonadales bacterium]|jgi:flagellar protein FliO/FliZ
MTTYPEFLPSLLQMLASLAVVLGGLLLTLWFFKRFVQSRAGGVNNRLIRVLASSTIGLKKTITLVDVPGAILVLGVTGDRISLLARIEEPEIMRKIRGEIQAKPVIPFAEHLQFFSGRLKGRLHGR